MNSPKSTAFEKLIIQKVKFLDTIVKLLTAKAVIYLFKSNTFTLLWPKTKHNKYFAFFAKG
jgi:hypothetical protein